VASVKAHRESSWYIMAEQGEYYKRENDRNSPPIKNLRVRKKLRVKIKRDESERNVAQGFTNYDRTADFGAVFKNVVNF
jgi:hypothetical protein